MVSIRERVIIVEKNSTSETAIREILKKHDVVLQREYGGVEGFDLHLEFIADDVSMCKIMNDYKNEIADKCLYKSRIFYRVAPQYKNKSAD